MEDAGSNPAGLPINPRELPLWRNIRSQMPSRALVAAAAAARSEGDWRTAATLMPVTVDIDLNTVHNTYGSEATAALEDDLRHLCLDLLWWHLPRHAGGRGTLQPQVSAVLAPRINAANSPLLRLKLPKSPQGPQRGELSVVTLPDLEYVRWFYTPRYTWDVRCIEDQTSLWTGDDIFALLAEGNLTEAWSRCGITVEFDNPQALQRPGFSPTSPIGVANLAREAAAAFEVDQVNTLFSSSLTLNLPDLTAELADLGDWMEVPVRIPTSPVPPELALITAGLMTLDDLHPLVAPVAAQSPIAAPSSIAAPSPIAVPGPTAARSPAAPKGPIATKSPTLRDRTFRTYTPTPHISDKSLRGVPNVSVPVDVYVRCNGVWHRVSLTNGRLTLHVQHSDEERQREEMLRALGGEVGGCLAVEEAWTAGGGRLPRKLHEYRRGIMRRLQFGDTELLLQGLADGAIDPRMRAGNGWSLLHMAVWLDHERVLPVLLGEGVAVDVRDRIGRTPLYEAVMHGGDVAFIRALLDVGADPHAETVHGATPASAARNYAYERDLKFLGEGYL
ncbi:ankyrin repeat domain-containing protein [Dactylosporangium sp. NPDC051541]|uniref:ankyrin repeat domain-containing protein n=1 Tax=Dactylosporangium sp. NPDC051541 TaxID=3363977 RepID=UPI00379E3699